MKIERAENEIIIRDNYSVSSISKTMGNLNKKYKNKFEKWTKDCTKLVEPCSHTSRETEEYFLQQCDALPISKDDERIKNYRYCVIMGYFKDKLKNKSSEFSFDMTDEEIEKWHVEQTALREEALSYPPEYFGLNIRGYYLPRTERNAQFYEESFNEMLRMMPCTKASEASDNTPDICFFFEDATGHCQANGGGTNLMRKLIIFRGITAEDIKNRSPRFLGYITAMRDSGKLPDFE